MNDGQTISIDVILQKRIWIVACLVVTNFSMSVFVLLLRNVNSTLSAFISTFDLMLYSCISIYISNALNFYFFCSLLGIISFIAVFILSVLPDLEDVGKALKKVFFFIFPGFGVSMGMYDYSQNFKYSTICKPILPLCAFSNFSCCAGKLLSAFFS